MTFFSKTTGNDGKPAAEFEKRRISFKFYIKILGIFSTKLKFEDLGENVKFVVEGIKVLFSRRKFLCKNCKAENVLTVAGRLV